MRDQPFIDWGWIVDHLDLIGERLLEHLTLTFLAVGIGLLISFPLAVYAYRHRRVYPPITWVTGVLYTIPSLALFALLVPFTGFSKVTAEIGLVSYTLLILIRNIVIGLQGVPADVKEAARGMGHSERQLLWRVELPMALPVIVAGLRIATVTTIGLVTVTAIIGEGGLGFIMLRAFRGLAPRTTGVILATVLSAALAIALDGVLLAAQRTVMPWARSVRPQAA